MSSPKPFRMRVRVLDGKPREPNKLKGQLAPHMDVFDVKNRTEFVFCVARESHLDAIRAKLAAAGLEEIPDGDTSVALPALRQANTREYRRREPPARSPVAPRAAAQTNGPGLEKKPYAFVPLPDELTAAPPVWHDGTGTGGRLSGEIRCELVTLTPLLVGWERRRIDDADEPWAVPHTLINDNEVEVHLEGVGRTVRTKSVLCPLRAPWGERPVLLPGDSIKGLLRHELGALLGAPMERVAERSYSYRPNSLYPNAPNPRLVPRLARIPDGAVESRPLDPDDTASPLVRVPLRLDLLPEDLKYDRQHRQGPPRYRFDAAAGAPYRGGQGAGVRLNSRRRLRISLEAVPDAPVESRPVPSEVQESYLHTIRHLADLSYGHFSDRHPDIPSSVTGDQARARILEAARSVVFQPGDLIWVEWDTRDERIVSLGWHYYYRWAYTDTVRKKGWTLERHGLFPLAAERAVDADGAPQGLSPVRRLFGYTGDNEGSKGIGKGDHEQLMGRLSVNAAIEVIEDGDAADKRFLPPTFLRELGMPRPSAVEHYLEQHYYPNQRPSDQAQLVTYGDAAGYDEPGKLAGRKFYLDRKDAYTGEPWKDDSEANRLNDRSTLALEASKPGRRFRFTVRFRDLDPFEVAAVLTALCPHQFRGILGGAHADGYCSKLGYARPLGWGSVRIEAKALLLLNTSGDKPELDAVPDLLDWVRPHYKQTPALKFWLAIHRHKHPDAADYPRGADGQIYSYHTRLRAEHSRARRYERTGP